MKYLILLLAALSHGKPIQTLPPNLEYVVSYGCAAVQVQKPGTERTWRVQYTALYIADGEITRVSAVREGKKGANDCKAWMDAMEKAIKTVKRPEPKKASQPSESPDPQEVRKT